ncbi:hypothetical protein NW765_002035 [Fusarium oxysporum]|nr:hypothetical protein NW765_002035 [Fusarium oxysporum]
MNKLASVLEHLASNPSTEILDGLREPRAQDESGLYSSQSQCLQHSLAAGD